MKQYDKWHGWSNRLSMPISVLIIGLLLAACVPITRPADTPSTDSTMAVPTTEGNEEEETMAATPENVSMPDTPIVATAKADLAERLGIDADQIIVVEVRDVAWRDGSLGCPQPDMMYAQVIINGMKIILSVDDQEYHYHSGKNQEPFLCENPDPDGGIG